MSAITPSTAHEQGRGTALGVLAIGLWAAAHSLIRLMSEAFGPVYGAALLYSSATLVLIACNGWTPLRRFPVRYLLMGGVLFASYEVALAMALGLAQSRHQAIEISLINYLWPCLTAALAVALGQQRASWWLLPGLATSMLGIVWILNGGASLSLYSIIDNARANPASYSLALAAACLWAGYCCLARRLAAGTDAIIPFFLLTSLVLWGKAAFTDTPLYRIDLSKLGLLLGTALVLAVGHAAWNRALAKGNLLVLAALSYATPVLSTLLGSVVLQTPLQLSFWQGVALVTLGSLICWQATLAQPPRA